LVKEYTFPKYIKFLTDLIINNFYKVYNGLSLFGMFNSIVGF
jgi:hypothetical protein